MGNTSTTAKASLSLSNAKNQLGKTFSGDSDKTEKSDKISPETRREMNERHRRREIEFKKRKQQREKKTASMQQKWSENRAKRAY